MDMTRSLFVEYNVPSIGVWYRVLCGAVSLENVAGDVSELERGMEAVRREAEARDGHRATGHVLRDFLANAADKLRRLRAETKHAQVRTVPLALTHTEDLRKTHSYCRVSLNA